MQRPFFWTALIASLFANVWLGTAFYRLSHRYVDGMSGLYNSLVLSMNRHQTVAKAVLARDQLEAERQTTLMLYSDLDIYEAVTSCVPADIQGPLAASAAYSASLLKAPPFYQQVTSMNLAIHPKFTLPTMDLDTAREASIQATQTMDIPSSTNSPPSQPKEPEPTSKP